MALRIIAGITFGETRAMEFTITELTGLVALTIRIDEKGLRYGTTVADPSVRWAHEDMSSIAALGGYAALAPALASALTSASLAVNALTYTVHWDVPDASYKFTATGAIDSITFAPDASGDMAKKVLGFSTSPSIPTSDVRAGYAILSEMGCKSNPTEVYEPDSVVEGGWTHGGAHFAIAALEAILFDDFDLYFESKEASFSRWATAEVPYTYQDLWEDVRGSEPFEVADDVDSRVYFLRPDAARFAPERAVANWDGAFHHKFKCYLAGYLP